MFERYTERARQVVILAQDEARSLKHNYIGTEHILLGMLQEKEGVAGRVLEDLGVKYEEVRKTVQRLVGEGDENSHGRKPFTPRTKKILDLAMREALAIGHKYVGTEHLLLALAREDEGVASRILRDLDADSETLQAAVLQALSMPKEPKNPVAEAWAAKDHLKSDEQEVLDKVFEAFKKGLSSQNPKVAVDAAMKFTEAFYKPDKDKQKGLYEKYNVSKADGTEVEGRVFILNPDKDKYARIALATYAAACAEEFPALAEDIRDWINGH